MTVTISLKPDEEQRLSKRAAAVGTNVTEYVQRLVRRDIDSSPSIVEAARPIAEAVSASGISDEELEHLVEEARQEAWDERDRRRSQTR